MRRKSCEKPFECCILLVFKFRKQHIKESMRIIDLNFSRKVNLIEQRKSTRNVHIRRDKSKKVIHIVNP